MQVVRYYQYLKGEHIGTGPRREEVLLRAAQRLAERIGDLKVLNIAMAKLHGVDLFCTCEPYLASDEVFGFQKRKANVPLGFEGESYRPDKVKFSCLWVATKSTRANHACCSSINVVEEFSPDLQENQALINLDTTTEVRRPPHVITIQEIACKETEWHIIRLPKTSTKACFVQ
jgi:hypothetical protein